MLPAWLKVSASATLPFGGTITGCTGIPSIFTLMVVR